MYIPLKVDGWKMKFPCKNVPFLGDSRDVIFVGGYTVYCLYPQFQKNSGPSKALKKSQLPIKRCFITHDGSMGLVCLFTYI